MANLHLGIDIGTKKLKNARITEVRFGIVTIAVFDFGSEMTIFPRYAVRRTLNEDKKIHQSVVTYGDDIRETCRRALAFDDGKIYHDHREVIIGAYNEAADFISSSAYDAITNTDWGRGDINRRTTRH